MGSANKSNKKKKPAISSKKLAIIGFILMLSGPAVLYLSGLISVTLPKFAADFIMWITIILPGIGSVLSIISLVLCKRTGRTSHVLSIITLVMCNPFFYFIYVFICTIMGNTLAGISWM